MLPRSLPLLLLAHLPLGGVAAGAECAGAAGCDESEAAEAALGIGPGLLQVRTSGQGASRGAGRPALALIIPGLQWRLLPSSKARRVVRPLVEHGFDVDVFIDIVNSSASAGTRTSHTSVQGQADSIESLSRSAIVEPFVDAGARLVDLSVRDQYEDVTIPDLVGDQVTRLYFFPPQRNSSTGINVLRRYKTVERLMNATLSNAKSGGFAYDYVLWDKDDNYWLGDFVLPPDALNPHADRTVFVRDWMGSWPCAVRVTGVSDKVMLFGREAALTVLPRLYSDFWSGNLNLNTSSTENYLGILIGVVKAMKIQKLPHPYFAGFDSAYFEDDFGQVALCLKPSTSGSTEYLNDESMDSLPECTMADNVSKETICDERPTK